MTYYYNFYKCTCGKTIKTVKKQVICKNCGKINGKKIKDNNNYYAFEFNEFIDIKPNKNGKFYKENPRKPYWKEILENIIFKKK